MSESSVITSNAAAEFFKNKKKKGKKAFTFNANLVNAETIAQQHVDAPALLSNNSNAEVSETATARPLSIRNQDKAINDPNSEWDDAVVISIGDNPASSLLPPNSIDAAVVSTSTAELGVLSSTTNSASGGGIGNIGTLSTSEYYDDSTIAEKLRVEETRAQLAAARIGMERQAAAAAEAKAQKEQQEKLKSQNLVANTGGRWVPSHIRNQTTTTTTTNRFGGAATQKLDVASTELFPDLHTAVDKMEKEKQQQQQKKMKAPTIKKASVSTTKTGTASTTEGDGIGKIPTEAPVAAGTLDTASTAAIETSNSSTDVPATTSDAVVAPTSNTNDDEGTTTTTSAATPTIAKKTTTIKKKKKDLSTFKVST